MKLIGLTGKARSGKDTLARMMITNLGYSRLAFADPMKKAAAAAFGTLIGDFHDDVIKNEIEPEWNISRRRMMQATGQIFKTEFGEDFWVRRLMRTYDIMKHTDNIVITDVRFDAEAKAIIQNGGRIVEIIRENSGLQGDEAQHISESGISPTLVFHRIRNDGTIQEMYEQMLKLEAGL